MNKQLACSNSRRLQQQDGTTMQLSPDALLTDLRHVTLQMVREERPDLTARQLAVFLTTYLDDGPHTVARMAAHLNIQKPAVTRAIDRLAELGLARRKADPADRRKIHIQRTEQGIVFLARINHWVGTGIPAANDNVAHQVTTPLQRRP